MATLIRIGIVLASLAAAASAGDFYEAPRPAEAPIPWGPMGVALLAVAAVGAIAFKKTGRTHLD